MILNIFFSIKLIKQFIEAKKIQGNKLPKSTIFQKSKGQLPLCPLAQRTSAPMADESYYAQGEEG
jgi:hypothetical protein